MPEKHPRKPLVWLSGEITTPPFSKEARVEAGSLLGQLQEGELLGMPHSRPMPIIGTGCHELRIRDEKRNWRAVYRLDPDAIVIDQYSRRLPRRRPSTTSTNAKTPELLRRGSAKGEEGSGEMNDDKRKALEAAGFVFGDAEDFLDLTVEASPR